MIYCLLSVHLLRSHIVSNTWKADLRMHFPGAVVEEQNTQKEDAFLKQ